MRDNKEVFKKACEECKGEERNGEKFYLKIIVFKANNKIIKGKAALNIFLF